MYCEVCVSTLYSYISIRRRITRTKKAIVIFEVTASLAVPWKERSMAMTINDRPIATVPKTDAVQ